MPQKTSLKSRIIDEKDKKILMLLQENGRESLTNIAKKVNLSIDSVKNRLLDLEKKGIFNTGIFIEPRALGYPLVVDIKIKLHNITEKDKDNLIKFLKKHPRVIDLLSVMGDFDLTCVMIAKSTAEFDKITTVIRQQFSHLIADWKSMLILTTHKFEHYDLESSLPKPKSR